MFDEYSNVLDASNFLTKRINYITRLKNLLKEIFENYKQLLKDKIKLSKDENKKGYGYLQIMEDNLEKLKFAMDCK